MAHPEPTVQTVQTAVSMTFIVFSAPPSEPKITRLHRRQFAYRENEEADLTCRSDIVGNPVVSYEWSYQGRNNVSPHRNRLIVRSLTWQDNGLEIGCRARNNFTDTKGLNLTTVFRLEVFYRPQIRFQSLSGSECLDADSGECTVDEGQRIRVECLAHSNPAIKSISWEKAFQTPVLDITASHSQDGSEFTCEAATETNETAGLWYPLVNSKSLRIRVQYLPDRPVLTLKSSELNVTNQSVKENDTVKFVCVGKARPKPSVKLMRDEQLLKSTDPSSGADKDDETRMSHTLQSASCEDSGRYSCVVSNGEVSSTTHASLFVRCPPRPADSVPLSQLNITYKGTQAQLTLDLVAYPLPNVTVTYDAIYADGANTPRLLSQDKFNGTCEETDAIYQARCTIWVQDVVSSDEGSYQLTVQNSEGSLDTLKFQLFVEDLPDRPVLTLKSSGLNVTNQSVKENDTVTFVCVGKARPKPSVKLMRDEQLLQSTDPSSAKDDEIRMSHILRSASCEDSGRYSCVLSNGEVSSTTHANLFVRCSPRLKYSMPQLNIIYRGTLEQLTFDLVAYPLPNVTIAYDALDPYGANTPRLVNKDKFNGTCEETVVTHHVRCNIWIQDVVLDDKGSYQLTVQNSEGSLDTLKFQLFVDEEVPNIADDRLWLNTSHIIGITVGAVCGVATIIAVVVFVVRARWKAYERPPPARLWEMHEYRALSPKPAPPRPSTVASDVADANPYDVIPADDGDYSEPITSDDYLHPAALTPERTTDQTDADPHPATLDTARASCNYDDCFNVATSTEDNVDQSEGTHHPVLEQASPEYSNIPHDEGQDHAPYSNVP
ncbi:hypothetical protein BaRGS_00008893 [Batillaria attramentaria]|uniref:Ig-like domain-containing protein n=1 Tax=Batillaria attramentaria TaxID=370345 RepID=A0ABD0LJT7_9CAEN